MDYIFNTSYESILIGELIVILTEAAFFGFVFKGKLELKKIILATVYANIISVIFGTAIYLWFVMPLITPFFMKYYLYFTNYSPGLEPGANFIIEM